MHHIVAKVAIEMGVPGRIMRAPTRRQTVFRARAEAMRRLKEAGYGLRQIGMYFGGRDHTTVLHAIERAKLRMSLEATE